MADIRSIAIAMESRAEDRKTFAIGPKLRPERGTNFDFASLTQVSASELKRALVPYYIPELPLTDGWGNQLDIRVSAQSYAIRSPGNDARFERDSYALGTIATFSEDVVFSDGNWIRYPEGI